MAIRSCILDPAETQQCRGQIKQREPNTSSPSTRAPRPRPPESAKRDPRPTTARRRLPSSFPPVSGAGDGERRSRIPSSFAPVSGAGDGERRSSFPPARKAGDGETRISSPPARLAGDGERRSRIPSSFPPIVCLQCLYYLALGLSMSLLVGTRVPRLTLLYFFDFATLTPRTPTGWCAIASFLLAAVAGAGFMLYVIERAKKCLDFAATLYIIHLFICIVYGGWPASVTWWVVNIAGLAIMALLGEYLCIRRELKEIPISRLRASV
uniref:Protein SYS1 homolog n=1 Tax=Setaria italica TaxID=4555 RepID=K3XKY8_SETIT